MEDIRRQEVRQLALLTARLDPTQQIFFQAEYSLHRRSPTTAFLLCVLLGDFGAHYFYFGRYRAGVVRLLFCWTLVPAVLALFDAHTMTARARRYNASLANELVLAIQGAVEEQLHTPARMVDAADQPPVLEGRRPAIAAPISTPEMEAIAAAAWVEREPLQDDPRDPPIPLEHLNGPVTAAPHDPLDTLDTHWPNALAHPVAPERYVPEAIEQHDVPQDDQIPVWPLDAAWVHDARAYPALAGDADHAGDIAAPAAPVASSDTPFAWPADDEIALESESSELPDEASGAITAEREPVMLYQVAPMPRRESVHLEPPPPAAYLHGEEEHMEAAHDPRLTTLTNMADSADGARKEGKQGKEGHAGRDEAALAALGSVLASGLAELLRERPHSHPTTWPITRPITNSNPQPPAPSVPEPATPEPSTPTADLAAPTNEYQPATPDRADQTDQATLLPLAATAALAASPAPDVAPDVAPDTAHEAYAVDTNYGTTPLAPTPLDTPADAATRPYDENWLLSLTPAAEPVAAPLTALDSVSAPVPAPVPETIPLPANPAPVASAAPIAFNRRRRVVQRVIVRKMAVLDGHVVAEATVERQVPVVHDEAEMAARIRMATRDAAREALGYLLIQAPEEARPSIREQLNAMQSDAMRQPTV